MELLNGHTNEENAFIVDSYPYGRLRCKKKFWIETTKHGDRLVGQTQNPKTLVWNKPKKTTYSDVMVLVKDEIGHIKTKSWGVAYTEPESLNKFLDFIGDFPLNDLQKDKIKIGKAIYKVRKGITYEIRARKFKNRITGEVTESIPIFEMGNFYEIDEEGNPLNVEEEFKKQEKIKANINQAVAQAYHQQQ